MWFCKCDLCNTFCRKHLIRFLKSFVFSMFFCCLLYILFIWMQMVKSLSCQAVTAPAAFVARPTVDHIKVDIKGLWHVHSSLSAPPNHGTCADELYIYLPWCRWSNCSPGQTFPGVLYSFHHHKVVSEVTCTVSSGTLNSSIPYHHHKVLQLAPQTLLISDSVSCFFFKFRLKTFCLGRLLLNTDLTCRQRFWIYDHIAL